MRRNEPAQENLILEKSNRGEKKLYCKTHSVQGHSVLACCDDELLGKTLSGTETDFVVSESFYGGEKVSENGLAEMLREAGNINLVGNKCIGAAIKEGLISERNIIEISGTKHAIIMRL